MDVVLIPGFWLDASSWDPVVPTLEQAGHRCLPLTLPGLEADHPDRSAVTLRDQIDFVIAVVDSLDRSHGELVLVGHSGGGPVAHAVADARPDAIARIVYVDTWPLGEGQSINTSLPVHDGVVPLPDWSVFDDGDLVDLDDELRAAFRDMAIPTPARVATDGQRLVDERRYDVPVTVIACEFTSAALQEWMAQGEPELQELKLVKQVVYIDLPTGHWPQFTRPAELAQAILSAVTPD